MASRFLLSKSAKFAVRAVVKCLYEHEMGSWNFRIMFNFLFNGFLTMCNLKKGLIRESF